MTLRSCLALVILSTTFACAQTGSTKSLADADAAWEASFHAGKLAEAMAIVSPDAVILEPNEPMITGMEKITAAYKELLSIPREDFSWTMSHVQVSGDMGFTDGAYQLSFTGPDGKPVLDKGKYLTVWHRDQAGKWWVIRDMFSTDLPAAK